MAIGRRAPVRRRARSRRRLPEAAAGTAPARLRP